MGKYTLKEFDGLKMSSFTNYIDSIVEKYFDDITGEYEPQYGYMYEISFFISSFVDGVELESGDIFEDSLFKYIADDEMTQLFENKTGLSNVMHKLAHDKIDNRKSKSGIDNVLNSISDVIGVLGEKVGTLLDNISPEDVKSMLATVNGLGDGNATDNIVNAFKKSGYFDDKKMKESAKNVIAMPKKK